jgi:CubicO group peptidase (beta-lactamase class C family)
MKNGTKVLIPVLVMAAMAGTAFLLPGLPWLSGEPVLANDSISDGQRAEIAAILEAMAANGQFSGTVLVSVRGEEVYSGAFGLADIERGVPNRVDTQFRIASATKPFTSLLVYQLVESGKLRFDDRLSDLVPEYPANKGADITVLQGVFPSWRTSSVTAGRERRCWRRSPGGIWCSSRGPETSTATTASSSSA